MEYCVEKQLIRLRQHVAASSSSSSAAAAAGALVEAVARVYEHAKPLARFARADQVDDELHASVALLDACAAARDALGVMRARARDAEAAARRGDGAAADAAARALGRVARKARADVRRMRRGVSSKAAADGGGHASLREARRLAAAVLECVVAALAKLPGQTQPPASGWSTCVARAFRKRARVACEDADETAALPSKDLHDGEATARAQRELRAMGDTIQNLEDGLELLFRRLVQFRVFLLNMHSF
ncbi:hypothetical protein PR202_gb02417 [Eleusine coracana subsp. coracana]|uniref:Uncharacterized protein n=1 Tax=Eleusine coracana subsp. coracana TaxID=191504 RepID=A0AAV5DYX0_ELECO|nr:hypothetical protein QOZ80_8BG0668760 [Eleusine coracana subsp. coracana]GJN15496.1 hypothetical protein PR202_gb02417 [Eleusine coracana subsp. coracana]